MLTPEDGVLYKQAKDLNPEIGVERLRGGGGEESIYNQENTVWKRDYIIQMPRPGEV